jgi:hypothetical protein
MKQRAGRGSPELEFNKGDQIRIEVRLDEPQEDVHIHGYDIEKLSPSGTVKFDFRRTSTGSSSWRGPRRRAAGEIVVNP